MRFSTTRVLRRAAVGAAVTGLAVACLQAPAAAGVWAPAGPYPTEAACESARLEIQAGGNLTQPCRFQHVSTPGFDGWYFKVMTEI